MSKHIFLILSLLMLCLLSSCSDSEEAADERSTTYRCEEIALPEGFNLRSDELNVSGNRIMAGGRSELNPDAPWEDQARLMLIIDENGETRLENLSGGSDVVSVAYTASGERCEIIADWGEDGDLLYYKRLTLRRYDADGNPTDEYDCGELFGLDVSRFRADATGSGSFQIRAVCELDGTLCIVSNTGAVQIRSDGSARLVESRYEIISAAPVNGELLVFYSKSGRSTPAYVDFDAGKLSDPLELPDSMTNPKPFALDGYEFGLYRRADGIYGLARSEEGEYVETLLCDFTASDLLGSFDSIAALSPECFYVTEYDVSDNKYRLYRLTMIPKDEIPVKTTLTLACVGYFSDNTRKAVIDFNHSSEEYRIDIVNYQSNNEDGMYDVSAFTNDIMAGKVPDIIILYSTATNEAENLSSKGLFCDLYSLGLDGGILLDCVRESCERDGTLPYLMLENYVSTLLGSASEFPEKLTLEMALDRLEGLEEGQKLMEYQRVDALVEHSLEEFVNFETGETSFDTPLFRRCCEAWRKYLKGEYFYQIETKGSDKFAALREGKQLLYQETDLTLFSYVRLKAQSGLDDITVVGHPDRDGSGVELNPRTIIGITAQSRYKEAAMDFLRLRLDDKYVIKNDFSCPIVTISAFDSYIENADHYYFFGDSVRYSSSNPINTETHGFGDGITYEIGDDVIEDFRQIVLSARAESPISDQVMSIIGGELAEYANRDDLKLDDVIKYIDNRVNTYINERLK